MANKRYDQFTAEANPALADILLIADPTTGTLGKVTLTQLRTLLTSTTIQTLTDGATITMNVANGKWGKVTLGGNRTVAFSGLTAGDAGLIFVTQDGTGGRTLSWPGNSEVPAGGLALSSGAGETTIIGYVYDGSVIWLSKEDYGVAPSGPSQLATPTLSATAASASQINLSWTNVANESSYRLEWSPNGSSGWTQIGGTIAADTTTYNHTGLTGSTQYFYRITAVGDGVNYSDSGYGSANATTNASDVTAPTVVSATVENADPDALVVVFSESVTVTTAGWSFKKNGSAWAANSVSGSGTTWTFAMATPAANGDTLLRSYDSGTGNTVDGSTNELSSFTDQAVTNNVAASYQTETTAFISAVEGGGDTLNAGQKDALDDLVVAMKAIGWTKFSAVYPLVGGTASAHKWNLIDPQDTDAAYRLTYSGSITHDANGFTGDGTTGYANTHWIAPFTDNWNNYHLGVYNRTNAATSDAGFDIGVYGTTYQFMVWINDGAARWYPDGAQITSSNTTSAEGFWLGTKRGNTDNEFYKNGVSVGTSASSPNATNPTASKVFFGAVNQGIDNGGAAVSHANNNYAFVTIGAGLTDTEAADYYTAVQAFQTALSRQI